MIDFPVKSDGAVRILPFDESHLTEEYVGWLNDPEVVKYSEQRRQIHTPETARKYFDLQKNSANWFLAIEAFEETPVHIGNIGILVDNENNSADLSIVIGRMEYWGTGAASKAWQLALDSLLDELGFRMATAGTMEVNKPMVRLMERSGMNIDGVLPKRLIWKGREVGVVCASKSSTTNILGK